MPDRLRAHAIDVTDPTRASQEVAAAALRGAPRARPVLLLVVSEGTHPGLRPSPWVLDGVLAALEAAELHGEALHLGARPGPREPITDHLAARGWPASSAEETIVLRPSGTRRSLRVSQAWPGCSLCLVLPGVHRRLQSRRADASWWGPLGTAFGALAEHGGRGSERDPASLVARSLAEVFTHISVVIDGSWWAPLAAEDRVAPLLLAPQRALSLRLAAPLTTDEALEPRRVDTWLGAQIGLPGRRPSASSVEATGPAARDPWPRLPRTPPRRAGLAEQTVGALWRRIDRPARRDALPPVTPGPLARLWDEYERPTRAP